MRDYQLILLGLFAGFIFMFGLNPDMMFNPGYGDDVSRNTTIGSTQPVGEKFGKIAAGPVFARQIVDGHLLQVVDYKWGIAHRKGLHKADSVALDVFNCVNGRQGVCFPYGDRGLSD